MKLGGGAAGARQRQPRRGRPLSQRRQRHECGAFIEKPCFSSRWPWGLGATRPAFYIATAFLDVPFGRS